MTLEAKERSQIVRLSSFAPKQREALTDDGAVILELSGATIRTQRTSRAFWYVTDTTRVLDLPSIRGEVAIYPDPDRFFVPESGGKALGVQEDLVEQDGRELRARLGIEGVEQIIPSAAATLAEIASQYFNRTGRQVYLFGPDYDYSYGRTKNPTNESGSMVARVGCWIDHNGLYVNESAAAEGAKFVKAVRVVVPGTII